MAERYQRPGWFTKQVFNRVVAGLTRLGISVAGSRVLEVRGRTSGEWRRTYNCSLRGARYLVRQRAPHWVKIAGAARRGGCCGRRAESFRGWDTGRGERCRCFAPI